jgi:hypothetical protein
MSETPKLECLPEKWQEFEALLNVAVESKVLVEVSALRSLLTDLALERFHSRGLEQKLSRQENRSEVLLRVLEKFVGTD